MGGAMDSASASTVSVWHCVFSCFRRPGETTVGLCVCVCLFWAHLQNQCITSVPTVRLYLDSLGPLPIITGT